MIASVHKSFFTRRWREATHIYRVLSSSSSSTSLQMTPNTQKLADTILEPIKSTSESPQITKAMMKQRQALSKAITLIESHSIPHMQQGDLLLNHVIKHQDPSKKAFRVGIAGAPGAGKSSLIESLGKYIVNDMGYKMAVVCIDPSSTQTGGSILGDKTRMMELSRHPHAFVRPSPSKGVLGGLSSYSNDVVSLCEAAGYNFIIVETVGLGQSEVDISQVVDMTILVVSPAGGDGLQGVKKGILEVADIILVNKADGHLLQAAKMTRNEYKSATCYFRSRIDEWPVPPVLLASAETGDGLKELWEEICKYKSIILNNGLFQKKRASQSRHWMWNHMQELLTRKIQSDEKIRKSAAGLEEALEKGTLAPRVAATELFNLISRSFQK